MNQNRKRQFDINIKTINDGLSIYSYVEDNAKNIDACILLRALFSMIISAFDTYLHGILEDHIIADAFNSSSKEINDFDVNLSEIKSIFNVTDLNLKEEILRLHVRKRLAKYSFQSPSNLEYVMKQFAVKHCWQEIGKTLNMKAEDVRKKLAFCVNRRNKISHESDWNPVTMAYDPISIQDVKDCMDLIQKLVDIIDNKLI